MKQITSAAEVIRELRTSRVPQGAHGVTYALYAPGDMTLYRVALCVMWPIEPESELSTNSYLLVTVDRDTIAIRRPRNEFTPWTLEQFITEFTDKYCGWWAAVRPLLAALKWTPEHERSTEFEPTDWQSFSHLI
jgi:hypothetical protein